jgi:hypothetical protein
MPQKLIDGLSFPLTIPEPLANDLDTESVRRSAFAGEWEAFPSSAALGVLLRPEAKSEPGQSAPKTVFAGDLSVVATPDLISFIAQGRYTGMLYVRNGVIDRYLVFRAGKLCWGGSNDPGERLGEVAVRAGLLTRERLQEALAQQSKSGSGAKLGQSLVRMGLLTGLEQWKAVQLRITEILYSLLVKSDGAFVFLDMPHHPGLESHLSLDLQGLLLEGFSRVDEMKHFRERIASSEAVFARLASFGGEPITENEERILNAIDGQRTVLDLGIATGLGEFEATKAVFHLLKKDLVTFVYDPRQATPTRSTQPNGGRHLGTPNVHRLVSSYNRVLADAYRLVNETDSHHVYATSLSAFLVQEAERHELTAPIILQTDGTLAEEPLLKSMGDSSKVMTLMSLLDQVLSFALFQLRELVDPDLMERFEEHARSQLTGA